MPSPPCSRLLFAASLRYQVPPDQLAQIPEVGGHVFEAAVGDPIPIETGPKVCQSFTPGMIRS